MSRPSAKAVEILESIATKATAPIPAKLESLLQAIEQEESAREVESLRASEPANGYGCLMVGVKPDQARNPVEWAKSNIPPETLTGDGIETEPHVTLFYGFPLGFDLKRLQSVFAKVEKVEMTLGKVSRFECPEYDVLKVDVLSPQLEALHQHIAEAFKGEVTPSQWEYHPHLTLAYVKKGSNQNLDGAAYFGGIHLECFSLTYSEPEKTNVAHYALSMPGQPVFRPRRGITASEPATIDPVAQFNSYGFQDGARQLGEEIYSEAVRDWLAAAQAEAYRKRTKERRKKAEDELLTLWLMTMEDAAERAFVAVGAALNTGAAAIAGTPTITHPSRDNAREFAAGRQKVLSDFATRTMDRLKETADKARQDGADEKEVLRRVRDEGDAIDETDGRRVVQVEGQTTYGATILDALRRAGFTLKSWVSMRDDRVRHSHQECDNGEAIPLDATFPNGLLYPGQDGAPLEEISGCRCYLEGSGRVQP